MNRDDALKKVKKCLALSRSAEPHEASAALRQAQKLMAEHRISDHELSMADVHEVKAKACSMAINVWESWLTKTVADAFGCEHFASLSEEYDRKTWAIKRQHFKVFVGLDAAPTIAAYAFEVLARQCARARLAHIAKQPKNCKPITKTARGDAFAKGWVVGVRDLVQRFAQPSREQALLLAYMETAKSDLKEVTARDTTKKRRTDIGHNIAGMRAAEGAQLAHGVGGLQERQLLG